MFIFYIPLLLQVLLIVHAFKTGRDRLWIYVMIFLPYAGGIAYLIVELLPEFFRSSAANSAKSTFTQVISPNREFELLQSKSELSPTFENLRLLGEEYLKRQQYGEAVEIFTKALKGPSSDNPHVLLKLGEAYYQSGQYESAKSVLYRIYNEKKEASSLDVISLLAEAEELSGNLEKADDFYLLAAKKGSDFKYRFNYGKFLIKKGDTKQANEQFLYILNMYETLPPLYRKKNRVWVNLINEEMKNL